MFDSNAGLDGLRARARGSGWLIADPPSTLPCCYRGKPATSVLTLYSVLPAVT